MRLGDSPTIALSYYRTIALLHMPTDYGFTGQKRDASTAGLMYYGARYYDPALNRFIQPDTIVPNQYNPQDLNRYGYTRNNPLRYTDPSGHCPICFGVVAVGFLLATQTSSQARPLSDSQIRDEIGGSLVRGFRADISKAAETNGISEDALGAVIRHESGAKERRLFGPLGDMAEHAAAEVGDYSIGIGQMKLSTAESLEQQGYMPALSSREGRIQALLDPKTAIRYSAAELHRINEQLQSIPGFGDLSSEEQIRLGLIGYNRGWEGLKSRIQKYGLRETIELDSYDNQTLDEYDRWESKQ